MNIQSVAGEGHYFEETVTVRACGADAGVGAAPRQPPRRTQPERIRELLNRSSTTSKAGIIEKNEGMKYLLAVSGPGVAVQQCGSAAAGFPAPRAAGGTLPPSPPRSK